MGSPLWLLPLPCPPPSIVEVSLAVLAFVVVLVLASLLDMASGSVRLRLSLRPMLPSATDTVDMVWAPLPLPPSLLPPLLLPPPSSPPGPWPVLLLPSPPLPSVAASLLAVLVLAVLALLVPTPGKIFSNLKLTTTNEETVRRSIDDSCRHII